MSRINHVYKILLSTWKNYSLTTPHAIILAAFIISGGIIVYGAIIADGSRVRPSQVTNPLPYILKNAGIDAKAFAACVAEGDQASTVASSVEDGEVAGVDGTPTTFVIRMENDIPYVVASISGAQPVSFFTQAIKQALNGTSTTELTRFLGRPINNTEIEGGKMVSNVYVVEYSDTECPFCIRLHNTMKQIRTDYAGQISFVYRNFPLTSIHRHAQKEAEMISCVHVLGGEKAMYSFIDALFSYKMQNNSGYIPTESN
jgi:protein-disulfide isomerase